MRVLLAERESRELDPEELSMLAEDLSRLGRQEKALEVIEDALFQEPGSCDLREQKVELLRRAGRRAAALQELELLLELRPRNPVWWYECGELRADLGLKDPAHQAFQHTRELDPWQWRAYVAEAVLLARDPSAENLARAIELLSSCPPSPESGAEVGFLKGVLEEQRHDPTTAAGHYQEVLRIAPEHRGALLNLARIQEQSGEHAQARRLLQRARAVIPPEETATLQAIDERLEALRQPPEDAPTTTTKDP